MKFPFRSKSASDSEIAESIEVVGNEIEKLQEMIEELNIRIIRTETRLCVLMEALDVDPREALKISRKLRETL